MVPPINRRSFVAASLAGVPLSSVTVNACPNEGPSRRLIYGNALTSDADVGGWTLEGSARVSFDDRALNIENTRPPEDGQAANIVFWSDVMMTGAVDIEWEFRALREPGLCVLLMFADGLQGRDLFSPELAPRAGIYEQYIRGDIRNIGLSYFRRRFPSERAFHLCNLRRNPGFELLDQAADPLPSVIDWPADTFYRMRVRKTDHLLEFFINDLPLMRTSGNFGAYASGYLGFRQMAPLIGEYRNLAIYQLG